MNQNKVCKHSQKTVCVSVKGKYNSYSFDFYFHIKQIMLSIYIGVLITKQVWWKQMILLSQSQLVLWIQYSMFSLLIKGL